MYIDYVMNFEIKKKKENGEMSEWVREKWKRVRFLSSFQWSHLLIHMFTSYNEIIQWDQIPWARHSEEQRNERINIHSRICAHYLETEGLRFSPRR